MPRLHLDTRTEEMENLLIEVVSTNFSSQTIREENKAMDLWEREIIDLYEQIRVKQDLHHAARQRLLAECESILEEERVIRVY